MKKKKKPVVLTVFFTAAIIAAIILLHIGLNLEIEKLTKEKIRLEEKFSAKRNINTVLKVEIQKLASEDRIIQLAESRNKLMKFYEPFTSIKVNKDQIEHITKTVNSKYD